jgi:hypothetical protein
MHACRRGCGEERVRHRVHLGEHWVCIQSSSRFVAPFIALTLLRARSPLWVWALPALIYFLAIAPAWLAGWPLSDLLTVYLRQVEWSRHGAFIGTAPNPWLLVRLAKAPATPAIFRLGYAVAASAVAAFLLRLRRASLSKVQIIAAAALSAAIVPWLLPKMHERFFGLFEVLAFCLAWVVRNRAGAMAATLAQAALLLTFSGILFESSPAFIAGFVAESAAVLLIMRFLSSDPLHLDGDTMTVGDVHARRKQQVG